MRTSDRDGFRYGNWGFMSVGYRGFLFAGIELLARDSGRPATEVGAETMDEGVVTPRMSP